MKRMLKKLKPLLAAVLAVNMMITPIASFAEQGIITYENIVGSEDVEIDYENNEELDTELEDNVEDTDSELEGNDSEDDNIATLPSFPDEEEITVLPEFDKEEAVKIPENVGEKLPADVNAAIDKAMYFAEHTEAANSYRNSSNWEMLLDFKLHGIDLNTSPWYAAHTWKSVAPTGSSNPSHNSRDPYSRNIFSLLANDIDPSNVWGGRNLFNELADLQIIKVTDPSWQEVGMLVNGVGTQAYAIIALNTGKELGVDVGPWNIERERLAIELLMSWQTANGNLGSLDETGMALVALVNYTNDAVIGAQVQAAIEKAVKFINDNQLETGGFSSSGNMWDPGENSNSIATAIQGLIAVGENIYEEKWIKDGNTMVDALVSLQLEDGSFKWKPGDTTANATAFAQSLAALLDVANNKSMRLELAKHVKLNSSIKIDSVNKAEDKLEVTLTLVNDKFSDIDNIKKSVEVKLTPQIKTKTITSGAEISRISDTQIKITMPSISTTNQIEITIKDGGTQKNLNNDLFLNFNYAVPQNGKIEIVGKENVYIENSSEENLVLDVIKDTELPNINVVGDYSSFIIDQSTKVNKNSPGNTITVPQLIKEDTDISTITTHITNSLSNYTNVDLKSAYYMGDSKTTLNNHFTLEIPNKTRSLNKTFVGYYDGDALKSVEVKSAPSSGNIYAYQQNGNIIVKSNFTTTISVFTATYVPPVNTPKISVTIDATKGNQGSRSYQVDYMPGDTAFDVLKRTGASVDSTGNNESVYVVGINGLNERAHGSGSGWMYSVNGTFPDISSGSYKISPGDRVSWVYTTNLGQDVGANRPGISIIPGVVSQNYTVEDLTKAVELGASWILKNRDFSEYDQFADWDIMVIANSSQAIPEAYYKTLEAEVKAKKGEFRLVSDYERMVLALSSIGKDPRNVAGYDLVEKIYNNEKIESQGTNGIAFALIALDSRNYHVPKDALWSREKLVTTLLGYQNSDGGFPLAKGSSSDVDVTSMVIQGLSSYTSDAKVKKAVENALEYISKTQLKDGGFESGGSRYSETVAQAVIALSAMKISVEHPDFTKDFNLLDNLMAFQNEDGGFAHTAGEKSNYIATQQGLLALVSLKNLAESKEYVYKYDQIEDKQEIVKPDLNDYIPYSDEASIAPWALESVIKAQQYGIMKGTDLQKNTFDPKKNLTRAEFAAVLTNMISTEMADINFADVSKNAWYYEAVAMVVNIGAMTGISSTEFDPSGLITREQMAAAISRMMKVKAQDEIVPQDIEKSSAWAKDAIIDVVSAGLITGTDKGFEPKAFVTREMAAAIMVRIFEVK